MNIRKTWRALCALVLCVALLCPALAVAEEIEIDPVGVTAEPAPEAGADAGEGVDVEFDDGADVAIEDLSGLDLDLGLALNAAPLEVEEVVPAIEANEDTTGKTPLAVSYSGPALTKTYDCTNSIFKKNSEGKDVYAITAPKAENFQLAGIVEGHTDVQIDVASIKANADGSSREFSGSDVGNSYELKLTFGLKGADAGYYYCEPVMIPAAITPREVVVTPRAGLTKAFGAKDPVYKENSWLSSDETSPLHQDIGGLPGYAVPLNTGDDGKSKLTITNATYILQDAINHGTPFFRNDGWLTREAGEDVGSYRILLGGMDFGPNFTITLNEEYFTITARDINSATAEPIDNRVYNGKAQKPVPALTFNNLTLVPGADYTCTYANNKKIGVATVTVTGQGNYTGSRQLTFKIVPKAPAISRLKATSGQVTVSWKKVAGVTGYQVVYSLKSNFASSVKKLVKGASKSSLAVKGLKAGKTYYFRMRTYRTVNGKTYWSDWSKTKSVKAK